VSGAWKISETLFCCLWRMGGLCTIVPEDGGGWYWCVDLGSGDRKRRHGTAADLDAAMDAAEMAAGV
jgi:hypothetical protein